MVTYNINAFKYPFLNFRVAEEDVALDTAIEGARDGYIVDFEKVLVVD